MRKCDKLRERALARVGCPYVFATSGAICTPKMREERASKKPEYADAIRKYCPVLSGKKSTCSGCKYNGLPAFDCRGLTYRCAKEAGLSISSIGATSQWNALDWLKKGTIDGMPADVPCMVFRQKSGTSTMQHTGVYTGDGYVVDCRGHATGTVCKPLSSYPWTHYAIPVGAYDTFDDSDNNQDAQDQPKNLPPTIRKGDKGSDVVKLQNALLAVGMSLPKYGADGQYGSETVAAVKAYQETHDLSADGICGPKTWRVLLDDVQDGEHSTNDEAPEKVVKYIVTIAGIDAATATALLEEYGSKATCSEIADDD